MTFQAIQCESFADATGWADASGKGEAISVGGMYLVAAQAECDRLAAAGVSFAYLHWYERSDGKTVPMTVPVRSNVWTGRKRPLRR